jgi:two-component system LytT family sensor kinase
LQILGWGGLCVVTFLSLTLWYNTVQLDYIAHVFLQSLLGMLLSLPLRRAYLTFWQRSIPWRAFLSLIMIILVSALWTALRIWTFTLMTSEQGVWSDFGGWYFASFMVFLCWSALYYGNKYYFKAQQEHRMRMNSVKQVESEQIRRLSAEADAREAQLKMLRYQLNPHFLFNTLNTIGALVKFQEAEKAHRMIIQLADFLRYSLDNNPTMMITLEQEVDALMLYLDIEQTRFGDRLILEFDICEQAKKARVPALLLQPMIENSVKYAISQNEDGGTIKLKANVEQGELKIELSDTGPGKNGRVAETKKRGRRVGLHNTLERLKTLYEDAYLFDIGLQKSGGLKIRINIPFDSATSTSHTGDTEQLKSITA